MKERSAARGTPLLFSESASNEEAVRRRYGALSDRMDLAVTMLTLAMIRSYQDT